MYTADAVDAHYGHAGLVEQALAALAAAGKDIDALTLEDLAPLEEFHVGGREASIRLAGLAGIEPGMRVVDVGAGIGGPARLLARDHGCHVTALDLTEDFCALGRELCRRTGLAGSVDTVRGDALELPFGDAAFDAAWTQHAAMNIADKARLYAEVRRVLVPGAPFALNDVVAGPGGPPIFPVPWAQDASISFLATPDELRALLEDAGFAIRIWNDRTGYALEFCDLVLDRFSQGLPPLGLHLLLDNLPAKLANVRQGIAQHRLGLVEAVLQAV